MKSALYCSETLRSSEETRLNPSQFQVMQVICLVEEDKSCTEAFELGSKLSEDISLNYCQEDHLNQSHQDFSEMHPVQGQEEVHHWSSRRWSKNVIKDVLQINIRN